MFILFFVLSIQYPEPLAFFIGFIDFSLYSFFERKSHLHKYQRDQMRFSDWLQKTVAEYANTQQNECI